MRSLLHDSLTLLPCYYYCHYYYHYYHYSPATRLTAFVQNSQPGAPNPPPMWLGFVYAVVFFALQIISTLFLNKYFHHSMRTGMRVRSCLTTVAYRKTMKVRRGDGGGCVQSTHFSLSVSVSISVSVSDTHTHTHTSSWTVSPGKSSPLVRSSI